MYRHRAARGKTTVPLPRPNARAFPDRAGRLPTNTGRRLPRGQGLPLPLFPEGLQPTHLREEAAPAPVDGRSAQADGWQPEGEGERGAERRGTPAAAAKQLQLRRGGLEGAGVE